MKLLVDLPIRAGNKRHWTLRYIRNRMSVMWYQHVYPEAPWLTSEAIRLLTSMLRSSDRGAEYGSGRSTVWIAERVGHLTSIEHDGQWYATVHAKLKERGLTNVDYILAPQDQPAERGELSEYTRTALSFADASFDFVLVDGLYREHVTRLAMPKIKPGGLLIIDNVNWYLPSPSHAPASRTPALGPDGPVWTEVARDLSGWRTIWTSSGVWDTAIFVKP